MPTKTKIEWTETTWNPITGCTKISPGCKHCYAETMAKRLKAMGRPEYQEVIDEKGRWNGYIDFAGPDRLEAPLRWTRPRKIFVNSMSDLFHSDVPLVWIDAVFSVMAASPWHTYQVLTKRPERMLTYLSDPDLTHRIFEMVKEHRVKFKRTQPFGIQFPLPNVWLGVSVEDQRRANERIPILLEIPAVVKFLSCEPLLGLINLAEAIGEPEDEDWMEVNAIQDANDDYEPEELIEECEAECDWINYGNDLITNPEHTEWANWRRWRAGMFKLGREIDWIIAGGESGTSARPMHPNWPRNLSDQCEVAKVPFLFKQWGEFLPAGQQGNGIGELPASTRYHDFGDGNMSARVGKKAAGRLLDGVEHNQFPEVTK